MAKFHVGDIVKDTSYPLSGKFKIVQVNNDGTYAIKPLRGGATSVEKENFLVAANAEEDAVAYDADDPECPSTNPVVQNAMRGRVRNSRVVRNDERQDGLDKRTVEDIYERVEAIGLAVRNARRAFMVVRDPGIKNWGLGILREIDSKLGKFESLW